MLRVLLEQKNISLYRLERISGIPHATLSDIYNEKVDIKNVSVQVFNKLAKALKMKMDKLYAILTYEDMLNVSFNKEFDLFKSNICQELKRLGDKKFLEKYIHTNVIQNHIENCNIPKALYLVSLIDYLCEKHKLPQIKDFDNVRQYSIKNVVVSESLYRLMESKQTTISEIYKESIPLFLNHHIIESEIENVY